MEEKPPTRRRRFRFTLRTMLVLVTLVCVYLGWAMNWKRQRQAYRKSPDIKHRWVSDFETTQAPWSLYLLGESGESFLVVADGDEEQIVAVSRLFPEARIGFYGINRGGVRYRPAQGIKVDECPYYQNGELFQEEMLEMTASDVGGATQD